MSKSHATKLRDHSTRTRKGYALAQQLAAQAVNGWAIGDPARDGMDRSDDIGAVFDALCKGEPDPSKTLQAGLGGNRELSDTVGALMSVSEDAGFLYGLALGLALATGGAK